MTPGRRALIIGGSLGGLFAAHLLRASGWQVDVFARSSEDLAGRGAGLGTHEALIQMMRRIGIDADTALGVDTHSYIWLDSRGEVACELPLPRVMTAWSRLYRPLKDGLPARHYHAGKSFVSAEQDGGSVTALFADGTRAEGDLLIAADGARSRLRELAGIPTFGWSYDQSAIVCTVAHERDHGGRAEEHFLPAGPFAILPLSGRRSSIVWTEGAREAARIVALPDDLFHEELEQRFGLHLGDIAVDGPRRVHPLGLTVARAFVAERLALVGDAAHVIHPIAGQGLNLGLRDVAALAETIVDAARLGLDVGAAHVLERYQRWRRFDTMAMGIATDGLNRLFSNRSDALRLVRDVGLGLVDRLPGLKRLFIREAAGLVGDVPKLLRGEAL